MRMPRQPDYIKKNPIYNHEEAASITMDYAKFVTALEEYHIEALEIPWDQKRRFRGRA